jgi:hypothetical protein
MPTTSSRPRAARAALLAGAFALLTAAVPRCSGVSETTTAPAPSSVVLTRSMRGPCLHACADTRADHLLIEITRYRAATAACNEDPACLTEEAVLHDAILAEIEADFSDCQAACR